MKVGASCRCRSLVRLEGAVDHRARPSEQEDSVGHKARLQELEGTMQGSEQLAANV